MEHNVLSTEEDLYALDSCVVLKRSWVNDNDLEGDSTDLVTPVSHKMSIWSNLLPIISGIGNVLLFVVICVMVWHL